MAAKYLFTISVSFLRISELVLQSFHLNETPEGAGGQILTHHLLASLKGSTANPRGQEHHPSWTSKDRDCRRRRRREGIEGLPPPLCFWGRGFNPGRVSPRLGVLGCVLGNNMDPPTPVLLFFYFSVKTSPIISHL